MSRLIISDRAEFDLRLVWLFSAADNPAAADRLIQELLSVCQGTLDMPRRGSPRDRLRRGLRSIPHGDYLVFYREVPDGIEVARVLHGRRKIERAMEQ